MYLIFSVVLHLLVLSSQMILAEDCSSGEKLQNIQNCQFYWECLDGRLLRQSCGSGKVFSRSRQSCVALNSRHDDCTKREATLPRSTEVTTSACSIGDAYRSPDDCRIYFECQYPKYVMKRCIGSQVFSNKSRKCVNPRSEYNDCQIPPYVETTTPHCTVGEKLPNPDNSCAYFLCDNRYQLQEKQCPSGQVFNLSKQQCVTKYNAKDECSPTYVETITPQCTVGEKIPNPDNSCAYFLCDNRYRLQEKQCPSGQVFNPSKKQCVTKYRAKDECSPTYVETTTPHCTVGEILPSPNNSCTYLLCDNRYQLIEKQCPSGQVFNSSKNQCVTKYSAKDECSSTATPLYYVPGEVKSNPKDCSSYFLCDYSYKLVEKNCSIGQIFSPTTSNCVLKMSVYDQCTNITKPSPCTYGELLPKKDNCSSYFICGYNNELQEKQCETGKVFSPTRKQCVQKYSQQDNCSLVTKPSSCSQGELLPKKDNCSSYFFCDYNYELQEKQCQTGKVFSPTKKQCVQKYGLQDDCSQVTKPFPCIYGELLPKKDNCSSYFLCGYNNELQEKQCQTGKVFSPTKKQCVQKYGLQDDCSQVSTIPLCEPGKKYSDANNCNLYYLCRFGVRVRRICPSGQHYSVGLESCVIAYSNYDDCIIS